MARKNVEQKADERCRGVYYSFTIMSPDRKQGWGCECDVFPPFMFFFFFWTLRRSQNGC